jgi:ribonuclease T1
MLAFLQALRHTTGLKFSGCPRGFQEVFFMMRTAASRGIRSALMALLLGLALSGVGGAAARQPSTQPAASSSIALADLPSQGRATYRLILQGGPFAHDKDGSVFGNPERLLPAAPRGYWREYTVGTPGAHRRAARRIVCGGLRPTRPEACYYTSDHYASFRKIVE